MSSIDKRELREAAEKATPGPWEYYPGNTSIEYNVDSMVEDQGSIVYVDSGDFTQKQTDLNGAFIAAANPATVLALLDELERNQQYIKSRDQENEDIALTVGKLRVELEAAEKRIAELESNEVREVGNQFLVVRHPGKTPVIKHCTGDLEEFLRKLIEQDPLVTIDIITHRYYGIGGQWVQDAVEYLHMMSDAGIRIKGE
ncbi:ead/Ea22-like family protein [Escherichia coli]|uniref:ead/Ea22-like family protein n=1 Tax=Escherichia coli TaxID=562 RepID=UPI0017E5AA53|nr:ead/Ea22-like family protein [Escherichia coli]EIY7137977.1 ead/Ea22-like family protein [Escherichia coli]